MTVPNFDKVARPYRWMEYVTFGHALEHARTHFLSQLADRRSALVLGDGDGRFLACLLSANPTLQADAVDTSHAMLSQLTHRAHADRNRLRTHQTNALTFTPNQTYDLIVTHFFLDCLTQSETNSLAERLAPHVTSNAIWLVSDFRIPDGPMRWPARAMVRALYLAFRFLTGLRTTALPNHAAALTDAGFTLTFRHHSLAGLLSTEIWEYTPAMHLPPQRPKTPYPPDPVPDPEPPGPSLPEPDPGVFHHDIATSKPRQQAPSDQ
jgi:SAM-dependent methyltransferase